MQQFHVGIIGAGYVGLTTGLTLGYIGHRVTCFDINEERVEALRAGRIPIHEPHAQDVLTDATERIEFTTDPTALAATDIIFIAVNTPSGPEGAADLSYVRSAASVIGQQIRKQYVVIVNKSTVPIGSASLVEDEIRRSYATTHGGKLNGSLDVVSNPEFLREGTALFDSLYPDRIVLGSSSDRAAQTMESLYAPIVNQSFDAPSYLPRPECLARPTLLRTTVVSSELIKYASNAFLATKISFSNELASLAEASGADVNDVCRGMGLDHRIGTAFLRAGLGWGGSCFGKDTAALIATAREYGLEMPITEAARSVNERQRKLVVDKLRQRLKIIKGKTIGLLGLAFKPQTDDLRDSPALEIARVLLNQGARVRAHDPQALEGAKSVCSDWGMEFSECPKQTAEDADALILATEWPEYRDLAWEEIGGRMRRRLLIDGRNFLDVAVLQQAGFETVGIGR